MGHLDHPMDLLGFELPEFVRPSWASDGLRAEWEPRLGRIKKAWLEIEWLAVVGGIRKCALMPSLSPEMFVEMGGRWVDAGLAGLPLALEGANRGTYSSRSVRAEMGKPVSFRVAVGTNESLRDFKAAHTRYDDSRIAELLGYPACCYAFYKSVWVDQGQTDTTWPMAANTADPAPGSKLIEVDGPPEANILGRWLGVRAVPHLPCSFRCEKTVELGKRLIEIGRGAGFAEEMGWMIEILSWPVEWTALHGIAQIKNPLMRISATTDATATLHAVRRKGEGYPEGGLLGVGFPYRTPPKAIFTESAAFQKGMELAVSPSTGGASAD